jgi:hypothetical protein
VKKLIKKNDFSILCWSTVFITVAMTPWINSDSLIIPKLIALFCLALYSLPKVLVLRNNLLIENKGRILIFLSSLIFLQMLIVMKTSSAPLEQQIFGRTGRGLGFITEASLLIILISAAQLIKKEGLTLLQLTLVLACFISSLYSVAQRFNLDIFDWDTKTNGIIGTLGNPNFQSSFAAMAIVPTFVYFWGKKNTKNYAYLFILPLLAILYISESTQGYVATLASGFVFGIIFFWFKNRKVFFGLLVFFIGSATVALAGMLNKGPLSSYLYKLSVQSRGDFFRTSITVANDNPLFGIGLDSLGDYYLMYRDERTASSVGEFTDNSHNLFLNYATTGGYPLALLQTLVILLVLFSFFQLQKNIGIFDRNLSAIFCSWFCYQLQSFISPANIPMLVWNALISGSIIGLSLRNINDKTSEKRIEKLEFSRPFSIFLLFIALVITYPYFNVDRQQLRSARAGDGNLALISAKSYPESTIRYSRIGQEFIKSNLPMPALELARSAIEFNPNAPSAWALILVNNYAPKEERIKAKQEILRLDPFNKEIRNLVIPDTVVP